MESAAPIRWGILSTANIARSAFLPALRAAGGIAAVVGSRDLERGRAWAAEQGIESAVEGYEAVLEDDTVQAVYNPLPNALHAEWTSAALRAGKAVLCEKPLCVSVEETEAVLAVARDTGSLLWEAFVFPFHRQIERLQELLSAGAIGQPRELQSSFHFQLGGRDNIRLLPELGGGAVFDVGCYCLRLAQLVYCVDPIECVATTRWAPEGVDEETQAILVYPGNHRLVMSCGMARPPDTFSRLLGDAGEIRLSNPFHPGPADTLELHQPGRVTAESLTGPAPSFTRAIDHIQSVLRGEDQPRYLAVDHSLPTARALALVYRVLGSPA